MSFAAAAASVAKAAGRPVTFAIALGAIVVWALSGPLFQWGDTWQLLANTGTTLVTFLMMFLLQHTQNRDTLAVQAKLDELIHAVSGARDELERAEDLDEEEIEARRVGP